jgi:hypothetical protein
VADLLAIVSHDPAVPVEQARLDALVSDYEALRGPARAREDASTGWARVCTHRRTSADTAGVIRNGDDWTAWAGSPSAAARIDGPLADAAGQFSLVRLHADRGTVILATDSLGMKPLFVAMSGSSTYASTSALVLARHLGSAPSQLGCETFLHCGFQFGRITPWEGIERMRPAQRVEFSPAGRRTEHYWQPPREAAVAELPLEEAAQLCIERGVQCLRDLPEEKPWADLTGGFDSRLLALLASRAGLDFTANTVGSEAEEDVRLARRVAATAGWPWVRFGLPGDWRDRLPALTDEALVWGDGHLDALDLAAVMQAHREKSSAATTLLNGGGGEEFRDHPWGHELFAAGRSSRVDYERLLSWRIMLPVDLPPLRQNAAAAVGDAVRKELEWRAQPFTGQRNTFQDDILYAYKMTGHSGAYQAAAGAWIDLEVPFFGRPLLSALMSVPPRHRRFHRLMREMMSRLDPAVAALPTETGGPAEPPRLQNLHRFAPYAWRRGRRFGHRVRARLPQYPDRPGGPAAEPEAAKAALIGRLRAEGRLDHRTMRSASLYDRRGLAEMLGRAIRTPHGVDWEALGRVVTLELALEVADAGFG